MAVLRPNGGAKPYQFRRRAHGDRIRPLSICKNGTERVGGSIKPGRKEGAISCCTLPLEKSASPKLTASAGLVGVSVPDAARLESDAITSTRRRGCSAPPPHPALRPPRTSRVGGRRLPSRPATPPCPALGTSHGAPAAANAGALLAESKACMVEAQAKALRLCEPSSPRPSSQRNQIRIVSRLQRSRILAQQDSRPARCPLVRCCYRRAIATASV